MNELTDKGKCSKRQSPASSDPGARPGRKVKTTTPRWNRCTPQHWPFDSARRVGKIQAVTHVLKATHPDARCSRLHVTPGTLPQHAEIGTHLLGDDFAEDVAGNATGYFNTQKNSKWFSDRLSEFNAAQPAQKGCATAW